MKNAPLRMVDEAPDFAVRSVLAITPGKWRMRNGHIAHITGKKSLRYQAGGKDRQYPIWVGDCVDCSERKTWNIDGSYSAAGKHANDIVGPA